MEQEIGRVKERQREGKGARDGRERKKSKNETH